MSLAECDRLLMELGRAKRRIVAGPWMSEIGFELLYWIPFLRWCLDRGYLKRDMLTAVSRGGCRSWYAGITADYREILDVMTPIELCQANSQRIADQAPYARRFGKRPGQLTAKHLMSGPVDQDLLTRLDLSEAMVCHPSLMYGLFRSYWKGYLPDLYKQRTRLKAIAPPPKPDGLPKRYVAVKFYQSQACAAGIGHTLMVQQIVRSLAHVVDVVLLQTGTRFDDHGEFLIERHPRVHRRAYTPGSNLDEQTAVLAGASAFVCTYGGFAYLGPFVGVPTLALYGAKNFRTDHLTLMQSLAVHRFHVPFKVMPIASGTAGVKTMITKRLHAA